MLPSTQNYLSNLLFPLSKLYGWVTGLRNAGFDSGYMKQHKLPRPVISVGNITVGGTGKTPVVSYLADLLNQRNLEVAVLTRGYGRESNELVEINKDSIHNTSVSLTGDEPRILAEGLQKGNVFIDADRLRAGKQALIRAKPDVFILDDGFQHRRLLRDLDIVTIDAASPFGNGRLLPAGVLREPPSRLERADLLWVTRISESGAELDETRKELSVFADCPMIFSDHVVSKLIHRQDERELAPDSLQGRRVLAFCGIANPESFRRTLKNIDIEVVDFNIFRDHYRYTVEDLKQLLSRTNQLKAEAIITTEKDAVRIAHDSDSFEAKLFFPRLSIRIVAGKEELKKSLKHIDI